MKEREGVREEGGKKRHKRFYTKRCWPKYLALISLLGDLWLPLQ